MAALPPNPLPSRQNWVDRAKGLGIVLVVYGHVGRGLMAAGLLPDQPGRLVDSVIYAFHMPLFFLLSGLFFRQSFERRGPVRLMASKADALLYLYVLWSLLQGFVISSLGTLVNRPASGITLKQLIVAPPSQFWFLWALFLMFALGVAGMGRTWRATRQYGLLVVATGVYLVCAYIGARMPWWHVAGFFVYFWIGACLGPWALRWRRAPLPVALILLALAITGEFAFHAASLRFADYGASALLLALTCVAAVCAVCAVCAAGNHPVWRLLEQLGAESMNIYLLHILAASGMRIALHHGLHVTDLTLHVVLGCLAGLVGPVLLSRGLRRVGAGWLFSPPAWMSLERRIQSQPDGGRTARMVR